MSQPTHRGSKRCVLCGSPIATARLRALPGATTCIECAKKNPVKVDASRLRPAEVDRLSGDPGKAAAKMGWKAEVSLAELATEMVDADIARHRANSN